MGNVLYEVHFQFEPVVLIPIIILVGMVSYPWIEEKFFVLTGKELSEATKRTTRTFCNTVGCIVGFAALIVTIFQAHMFFKTVGAYKNGQYETVEGYVENFDPMPYEGHASESFEIDGVYFEYSDYNVTSGYHNAKSHGGVITGDGQYLKVGYIYYNSTYGNLIVYIEELSPPS